MIGYIYIIKNLQNGKKYVGQTVNIEKRIYEHFRRLKKNTHVNVKLQNAFNKYGEENFEVTYKAYTCEDKEELNQLEIKAIEENDSYYNGYNLTLGGSGLGESFMPEKYKFSFEEYAIIRAGCSKYPGFTNVVAKQEECANSLICQVKNGTNNELYHEDYEKLDKDEYVQKFIEKYNVDINNLPVDIKRTIFEEDEIISVLSFLEIFRDSNRFIVELKQCGKNTVLRLQKGETHKDKWEEFQKLDLFQREKLALEYKEKNNIIISGSRVLPISLVDLYRCFAANENGKTDRDIAAHYGLSLATVQTWLRHKSRKKEYEEYLNLDQNTKNTILNSLWP